MRLINILFYQKLVRVAFFILFLLVFALPAANDVYAGPAIFKYTGNVATKAGYDKVTEKSLSQKIGQAIGIVLSLSATIFLALTVYSGILWMTARGNEDQITKAKSILTTSIIGLIISLAAYGITNFVVNSLFGTVSGDDSCPWGPGTC